VTRTNFRSLFKILFKSEIESLTFYFTQAVFMVWNTDCPRTPRDRRRTKVLDVWPSANERRGDHCDPCLLSLRHCSRDPTKHRVCLAVFDSVNGSDSKTDAAVLRSVRPVGVTSVSVTRCGNWWRRPILFLKKWWLFSHRHHSHLIPSPPSKSLFIQCSL